MTHTGSDPISTELCKNTDRFHTTVGNNVCCASYMPVHYQEKHAVLTSQWYEPVRRDDGSQEPCTVIEWCEGCCTGLAVAKNVKCISVRADFTRDPELEEYHPF